MSYNSGSFFSFLYQLFEAVLVGILLFIVWTGILFVMVEVPYLSTFAFWLGWITKWPISLWKYFYCPEGDLSVCGAGVSFLWELAFIAPLFTGLGFIFLRNLRRYLRKKWIIKNPEINA